MVAGFSADPSGRIFGTGYGNEVAPGSAAGNNGRVIDSAAPRRSTALDPQIAAMLRRDPAGLIPAVIQEQDTGEVLMVGWMDDEALHRTITTGRTTFFSRSRNGYWVKGETSGNRQWVREVRLDCDGDTLLVKVHQEGPACHTGDRTCFDGRLLSPEPEA
jgi:phosphoribosyl-AMP cyclohydrolase